MISVTAKRIGASQHKSTDIWMNEEVTRLITKEIGRVEANHFTGAQSSTVSQPRYSCVPPRPPHVAEIYRPIPPNNAQRPN